MVGLGPKPGAWTYYRMWVPNTKEFGPHTIFGIEISFKTVEYYGNGKDKLDCFSLG
jgi:hypothetical protein